MTPSNFKLLVKTVITEEINTLFESKKIREDFEKDIKAIMDEPEGEYSHAPEMRVRSDEPQFDDDGHGDIKDLDEESATHNIPVNGTISILVLKNERFDSIKDIGQNLVKVVIGGKNFNGVRFDPTTIAIEYNKDIEGKTKNIASTVEGIHEYDYQGNATVDVDKYTEPHPYGMTTASEPQSNTNNITVEDLKFTPEIESNANLEVEDFLTSLVESDITENGEI